MEWGIVMAFPTVLGMLVLIFTQGGDAEYQTFGSTVLNAPARNTADATELRKAA